MKAVRIHDYGDRSVLRCENAPEPTPQPADLRIRVHTAAVNPADWQFRRGDFRQFVPLRFPAILGWDVAGTVESVDPEARGFRVGDPVYAMCDISRDGAYAELVAVHYAHVAPAPRAIPLEHAAAVPLAALTAWQSLFDLGQLQLGQSVLVTAAAGSVGQFAVQLARNAGARVVAVASPANHDFLRSLGAHECVDYARDGWADALRGFDLVLEGAGGHTRSAAWSTLRAGGLLVAIAMPPVIDADGAPHGCRGATAQVVPNGERLRRITELLDAGKLKVTVDSVFPLEDCAAAHERSESRHARGKVLLAVAPR